ncbi:unnamed protein product [Lactuca saligna]|uniref:Uncharacterized protein n=1 Tax=Lactuca saligna TaxID=75948 RepID=A0AA35YQ99_LACSI|nr:unnamed protein product [Lactuca saligna]
MEILKLSEEAKNNQAVQMEILNLLKVVLIMIVVLFVVVILMGFMLHNVVVISSVKLWALVRCRWNGSNSLRVRAKEKSKQRFKIEFTIPRKFERVKLSFLRLFPNPLNRVNLVRSILREKKDGNEWEDWSSLFISRKELVPNSLIRRMNKKRLQPFIFLNRDPARLASFQQPAGSTLVDDRIQ